MIRSLYTLFFFSLSCLFVLIFAITCSAKENRTAEKERIEKGIKTFRINISNLQEGISIQQELILSSAEDERNLLVEPEQLDAKLQKQLARLHSFERNMEEQEKFMEEAIRLSIENVKSGNGGPFGALVVRDGEIIAVGTNEVISSNDPTAHAEMVAIRNACNILGTFQLEDCEI